MLSSVNTIVAHKIQIKHPGISLTEPVDCTLFEVKNDLGQSREFYMEVATVVCGDSQCRIDTVQIFWDAMGYFNRLVLPLDVALEKAEGKPFDQNDYEKLDKILANKNGGLKEVYKEEVVGSESTEGMDGLSGATILLNTNDFVKGAVWTCYTLWHWTNGNIFSIIRNISGGYLSINDLFILLEKENPQYPIFALEQFIHRKIYQPEVIKAIKKKTIANEYALTKLTIQYFENATAEIYFSTLKELLKTANPKERLLYLQSIFKNDVPPPFGFYESISSNLSNWNDYPSINLFLNLLENKKVTTSQVINKVVLLLDNQNFIIARRAYWFLSEQTLSTSKQEQLNTFYTKHAERL